MLEREFQSQVLELLHLRGLMTYHTHDSRRSDAGFPDLVIVGPKGVAYRELKTEKGRVSEDQKKWLARLRHAGADADVWRPADFPVAVDRLARSLGGWAA